MKILHENSTIYIYIARYKHPKPQLKVKSYICGLRSFLKLRN